MPIILKRQMQSEDDKVIDTLSAERDALQAKLDELQKQVDGMKSSLLWIEVADLRKENDTLKISIDNLDREFRQSVEVNDALQRKLEIAKEALKSIRNKRYSWTTDEIRFADIVRYVDEALKQLEAE